MSNQEITVDDVLDVMPILARQGWRIKRGGHIRNRNGRCPLCALAHKVGPSFARRLNALDAARTLGLKDLAMLAIVAASDGMQSAVRDRLVQTLGARR